MRFEAFPVAAASLIFVNLQQCVTTARSSDDICFDDIKWDEHNLAVKTATQVLCPGLTFLPYITGEYEHLANHLKENGIELNYRNWLPLLNICPHLVT